MHWIVENNIPKFLGKETVSDCSIYDGWWDKDKQSELSSNMEVKQMELQHFPFDPTKGPLPGSGVQILPLAKINMPEVLKKKLLSNLKQQNEKGYFFYQSGYPKQLLQIRRNLTEAISNSSDPYDTHLKKNLSLIKLAFPYGGIADISSDKIIGYAAIGMWTNKGWSGVKEFFNDNKIGTCTYSLNNMTITQGAAQIPIDIVRYDINSKITVINVKGNYDDGFIYTVSWFDKTFSYDLECVNMIYNTLTTREIINLAKSIDRNETRAFNN